MTEDEVRLLLRELRDEPVPADSLVRVRLAVAQESRGETWLQRLGARWRMLGLLTAAAVIMVLAVRVRPVHQTSSPTAAIQHGAAVVEVPSRPATSNRDAKASTNVAAKSKTKNPRKTAPKERDVLVRIETADPDVVILLIGD